jgi:hypothetical protein
MVQQRQVREADAVREAPGRQSSRVARFVDNRPSAAAQRKLQELPGNHRRSQERQALGQVIGSSPRVLQQKAKTTLIQDSFRSTAQRLKRQDSFGGAVQGQPAARQNSTGLPDGLKSGIESMSGMSMDHVKVHYNSPQPAQLNAQAYAQGSDIHIAPGKETHLPHEAWHVVQQKQGRVKPTVQMAGGQQLNDDAGLEAEADVMGAKALGQGAVQLFDGGIPGRVASPRSATPAFEPHMPVQRTKGEKEEDDEKAPEEDRSVSEVRFHQDRDDSDAEEDAPRREVDNAEIVANTHAFLFTNLNRLSLWATDDVKTMKAQIQAGYVAAGDAETLSLPQMLGNLKDPSGSLDWKMQWKKLAKKKWKRPDALFGDDPRNRTDVPKASPESEARAGSMEKIGSLPSRLVRTESAADLDTGEKVPRKTRDQPHKKGATKYKSTKQPVDGVFDYDNYDYDAVQKEGLNVVNDPAGIHFGAGTSGTIGDTLIASRLLTKELWKQKKEAAYKEHGVDGVGIFSSSEAKQQKKDVKAASKIAFMRELATAAIAFIANEGHHSLIECVLPLEGPLKLRLDGPPEKILIQQIMPDRIRTSLYAYLDVWAEKAYPADEDLRNAVVKRLRSYAK